jgi:hypothetical protein
LLRFSAVSTLKPPLIDSQQEMLPVEIEKAGEAEPVCLMVL